MRTRNPPAYLNDYVVENGLKDAEDNDTTVDTVLNCYDFHNTDYCFKTAITVPKTYRQATSSPEAEKWKDAMNDEVKSLEENKTYDIVALPEGKTAIGGRWVYAVKVEPGGNERFKARYVAQGYSQRPGSDYTETFAPTPRMSTVRMLMHIAVQFDFLIHHMDVKTAYVFKCSNRYRDIHESTFRL